MNRSLKIKLVFLLAFFCVQTGLPAQWVRFGQVVDSDLKGLHFFNELNGVMVGRDSIGGNRGKIFRTSDGGISWQVTHYDSADYHWIEAVDFATPSLGLAASRSDIYYRSTDAGLSWDTIPHPGVPVQHETIEMVDQNIAYTANWRGEILKSTDGGLTWVVQFTAGQTWWPFLDITCVDAQNCYASGWNGTYRTTDGGNLWQPIDTVELDEIHCWDALNCIGVAPTGNSQLAQTWRTSDGGQTWQSALLPGGHRGKCMAMVGAEGYVGGENEAIYHTVDSGKTWTLVHLSDSIQPFSSITSIFLLDAQNGFACGNNGVFLRLIEPTSAGEGNTDVSHFLYPNPMRNRTSFVFSRQLKEAQFHLYDVRGKLLREVDFGGGFEFIFEDEDLVPAIYTYSITSKNFPPIAGKLIKR